VQVTLSTDSYGPYSDASTVSRIISSSSAGIDVPMAVFEENLKTLMGTQRQILSISSLKSLYQRRTALLPLPFPSSCSRSSARPGVRPSALAHIEGNCRRRLVTMQKKGLNAQISRTSSLRPRDLSLLVIAAKIDYYLIALAVASVGRGIACLMEAEWRSV